MGNCVGKLTLKWLREEYLFIYCIVLANFPWLKILQIPPKNINERAKEELYSNVLGRTTQTEYTI